MEPAGRRGGPAPAAAGADAGLGGVPAPGLGPPRSCAAAVQSRIGVAVLPGKQSLSNVHRPSPGWQQGPTAAPLSPCPFSILAHYVCTLPSVHLGVRGVPNEPGQRVADGTMQCLPWELPDAISGHLDTFGERGRRRRAAGRARGTPAAAPVSTPPDAPRPAAEDLLVPQQGSEDLFLAREDSLHSTDLFLPAFESSEVRRGARRGPHCALHPSSIRWQRRTPPASPVPAGHVFVLLGRLGRQLPVSADAPHMVPAGR